MRCERIHLGHGGESNIRLLACIPLGPVVAGGKANFTGEETFAHQQKFGPFGMSSVVCASVTNAGRNLSGLVDGPGNAAPC